MDHMTTQQPEQKMKKALTKAEILALFCKDMEQPAIQMALYNSFRRYATLRDQLVEVYVQKTKIPAKEFMRAHALHVYENW
jgi:hypothetical protein